MVLAVILIASGDQQIVKITVHSLSLYALGCETTTSAQDQ